MTIYHFEEDYSKYELKSFELVIVPYLGCNNPLF